MPDRINDMMFVLRVRVTALTVSLAACGGGSGGGSAAGSASGGYSVAGCGHSGDSHGGHRLSQWWGAGGDRDR